jgi:hypothetical protein
VSAIPGSGTTAQVDVVSLPLNFITPFDILKAVSLQSGAGHLYFTPHSQRS